MDKMSTYASQISDSGSGGGGKFAQVIALKKEVPNPIRIVDTPDGVERYYVSWMLCDDEKKRPFIIENDRQGKSILAEILGERASFYKGGILESMQDPITKKAKLIWEDKDPELMLTVAYNGDESGKSGSWKSREEYIFNAIQRNPDMDDAGNMFYWCKENKHTKILKMGILGFKHLQDVRMNDGNLSDYDINYIVKGAGMNTQHNIMKAGPAIPNVVIGPLTEEEVAYTRYDLIAESSLEPASKILQYLRNRIVRIDQLMGTNFIQRLEAQAAEEEQVPTAQPPAQPTPNPAPAPESAPQAPPARVPSRMAVAGQTGETVPCQFCKNMIPKDSDVCPSCKNTLMEECANVKCKKKFSVFESVCPHCGQEYKLA